MFHKDSPDLKERVGKAKGLYRNLAPEADLVTELIRERREEERRETTGTAHVSSDAALPPK